MAVALFLPEYNDSECRKITIRKVEEEQLVLQSIVIVHSMRSLEDREQPNRLCVVTAPFMKEWETSLWQTSSSLSPSAIHVQVDLLDDPGIGCETRPS